MSDTRDYLWTAERIGGRLCRDAVWAGRRCNWLEWSATNFRGTWQPAYRALGPTPENPIQGICVYDGVGGIALFLARLYGVTGGPVLKRVVEGSVNQLLHQLPAGEASDIGFYSGLAGIGYVLTEAGVALDHEPLVQRGISVLLQAGLQNPESAKTDVIQGSAGIIPALLDVARRHQCDALAEAARRHGTQLLQHAHRSDHGWSWDTVDSATSNHLTGYAHGTAGISTALLELFHYSGEEKFRDAALEGLRYESFHFSPEQRNWPDFRTLDQPAAERRPRFMVAWCHGATGIGISRLRCAQLLRQEQQLQKDIDVATETVLRNLEALLPPRESNQCLCHGAVGNAEFLLMAGRLLARSELTGAAEKFASSALQHFEQGDRPWTFHTADGGENPTLLLGLAGIGHFYLRLHDADRIPSILIIAPA